MFLKMFLRSGNAGARVLKLWIFSVIELFNSGGSLMTSNHHLPDLRCGGCRSERDEWLESLCDSLVVKSPTLVNIVVSKTFSIWYFSREFSCVVMPVCKGNEIHFFSLLSQFFTVSQWEIIVNIFSTKISTSVSTEDNWRYSRKWLLSLFALSCSACSVCVVESNEFFWRISPRISLSVCVGMGVFWRLKFSYALHAVFIPFSCGIFVYMLATAKETRNVYPGKVLLSIPAKTVAKSRCVA